MDVIEAQEGASTASVKAYWSLAPRWCYGSILVRQPSRGSGAFLDEAIRHSPRLPPRNALAYNLANFLRTLAMPEEVGRWSLTTLRNRLVKIGARVVRHGRSVIFQMAEVAVPRCLVRQVLAAIAALRPSPPARC
jgi:hypothetical protein